MNCPTKKQSAVRLLSRLYIAACVSCMIYQQFHIVDLYLQYRITATTTVYSPRVIDYLSATVCIPVSKVLNLTCLNRETSSNHTQDMSEDWYFNIAKTTTAYTLLKCISSANDIIEAYSYYHSNRSSNEPKPMDYVTERFLFDDVVCFKIRLSTYPSIALEDAAGLGALGYIFLNNKLNSTDSIKIAFGFPDKTPVRDILKSPMVQRGSKASKVVLNWFLTNHFIIETQSLPQPYESGCFDYKREGMNDDIDCINSCFINKTLEAWNEVPLTAVISKPFKYKLLDYNVFFNSSVYSRIATLKELCRTLCRKIPCEDAQVVTLTESGFYNDLFDYLNASFVIHHTIPVFPFVRITSRASQSIVEFFLNVVSTVSTWTGLSILGLNPAQLFNSIFSHKSKLVTLKQELPEELDYHRFPSSIKRLQKVYLLLASRDRQLQIMRHDFYRHERLINTLINSRLL